MADPWGFLQSIGAASEEDMQHEPGRGFYFRPAQPQDYLWPQTREFSEIGGTNPRLDMLNDSPSALPGPLYPQPGTGQMNQVYGHALGQLGTYGSGRVQQFATSALQSALAMHGMGGGFGGGVSGGSPSYQAGYIKGQIMRRQYDAAGLRMQEEQFRLNAERAEQAVEDETRNYYTAYTKHVNGSPQQTHALSALASQYNDDTMQAAIKVGPKAVEQELMRRHSLWVALSSANKQNQKEAEDAQADRDLGIGGASDQPQQQRPQQPQVTQRGTQDASGQPSQQPSPPMQSSDGQPIPQPGQDPPGDMTNIDQLARWKMLGGSTQGLKGRGPNVVAARMAEMMRQAQALRDRGLQGQQLYDAIRAQDAPLASMIDDVHNNVLRNAQGQHTAGMDFLAGITHAVYPDWDPQQYQTRQTFRTQYTEPQGITSRTASRVAVAAAQLQSVLDTLNRLPPEGQSPVKFRRWMEMVRQGQFGKDNTYADLELALYNYAYEVSGIVSGTGYSPVTAMRHLSEILSPVNSPDTLRHQMGIEADGGRARLDQMREQWDLNEPGQRNPLWTKSVQGAYDAFGRLANQFGAGRDGGARRVSSKAEYDALPSGATFTGPDGKRYTKP